MSKKPKEFSTDNLVKVVHRVAAPDKKKPNEGEARFYFGRGRLVLSNELQKFLGLKLNHYELFIDKKNEFIALKFVKDDVHGAFKASSVKGGGLTVELRGALKRANLKVKSSDQNVAIVLLKRDIKSGYIYFDYDSFAEPIPEEKTGKSKESSK